jgi:MFS family permease
MTSEGGAFAALKHKNFSLYLGARLLATLAVQMQSVAIGWQVYAITGNALDLGLIGLAQFLPFVVLVLPAGQVADRFERRTIIAICYAVEVLCALLLLAFTLAGFTVLGPVFAVLALFGAARAFAMPASQALTPNLVPRAAFSNAIALNSSTFYVATIVGPSFGGLLYVLGPDVVYESVAVLLVASVLLMIRVRLPPIERSREPASLKTLLEGLHFVRSKPVVLGAISLDLFAVLFGGATALLPAFAADVLHVGPEGLGILRTAPAVGAGITAAALAAFPISHRVGGAMFTGVAIFGVATVVFGASEHFGLSLVALALLGAGDMVSVYVRQILIQLETPDVIRGRVSAVNAVFIGASNELGEFRAGVMAAFLGIVPAVVIGGAATLVVTGMWMKLFPALRDMDRFPDRLPA